MHHTTGRYKQKGTLSCAPKRHTCIPDVIEDCKMLSVNLHRQQTMSLHASAMCERCNVMLTLQNVC